MPSQPTTDIVISTLIAELLDYALKVCTFDCCGSGAFELDANTIADWSRQVKPNHVQARAHLDELIEAVIRSPQGRVRLALPGRGGKQGQSGPNERSDDVLTAIRSWRDLVSQD